MKNKIQILDGGMGRELLRIGAPFAQPEWSALALMQAPDMVARAHRHFIDAGAEIITANTYALIPFHVGHDKDIDDLSQVTTLRSGEELDLIEPILTHIDAVLFNCSQPEEMEDAIKGVRTMGNDIQIGAYANNFSEIKRTVDANKGISQSRDDITPEVYLEFAKIWMDSGATIIGGCRPERMAVYHWNPPI